MGRLDRRVRGRRIRRRNLVDSRVLRAGIRQGQRHGVRGDAGAHEGRVVQERGRYGGTCKRRGRDGGARRQRRHRQGVCAQAADRHRTHGDCVGPCERAACSTRQYEILGDLRKDS